MKKLVDSCLTDMKLSSNLKTESINFGEYMQGTKTFYVVVDGELGLICANFFLGAMNVHEGPWYLEDYKLISSEFQKLLDIQPLPHPVMMMASPR